MRYTERINLALVVAASAIGGTTAVKLTGHAKGMFDESMNFLDQIYDPVAGYLQNFYYPLAAGGHETRSSAWYASGLLQRNKGNDLEEAVKIITNIIGGQEKNVSAQWFGDYTVYPEQPTVGSPAYAPVIYNSWDPNWRGFIGTTFMVIYEEFQDILPEEVKELILESMYNNTIGDSYRVGGVDDDNLVPSYSNPSLMRAVASGWTGRKLNESNMTAAGELYATEILDLFNLNNTLSEFNSPTYLGVSLYALTLWAKYMPEDSVMGQNGKRMIQQIWETAGEMYNANMKNLAPPWDRAYGYDMNQYMAIFSLQIWSLVGKKHAPVASRPWAMTHADDFEYAPLIAILSPFHDSLVPKEAVSKLLTFPGEHTFKTSAFSPPADYFPRNITTWLSDNLTIGAESFNEAGVGGPRLDSSQWTPAAVQWLRCDGSVGYMFLYQKQTALDVDVAANTLSLSYPRGNSSSVFSLMVKPNPRGGKRDMASLDDIEGVKIEVSGSVDPVPEISFCGLYGGTCDIIHGFEFWNFTYTMPANSTEIPRVNLKIDLST
ncbi:hypothetical protein JX265_009214 [Neoarthrinium moseri]|uniref:Uncharacterized protein n=1 Tax=Neoarthrinium moseri TaxID=1658444 RepID=A0A9Q0AMX5_9PEZI|nr:uncharacterized protein JN550_006620 [Neoarthrinium moseri]KAI1847786.1 hypothetical protein JX266_006281 [Neoarthrinium moseri]KAI1862500.1 hypothetical protein JX265_009214 [Neoarthrinium moseri]KAI1868132.1 hypothetical protein JN550_006620 [Neoarthrinium moseri]